MESAREELVAALRASDEALAAFEALPPSHQRRWVEYVSEAKKEETRRKRIARCLAELSKEKPDGSSGYSGTPLLQKLGIREGRRVALLEAAEDLPAPLASLETAERDGPGPFDVIVLFARNRAALEAGFPRATAALHPEGGLWVAWPKRASGVATDLSEDDVRRVARAAGLVDNKVCAMDQVWSGLRCVVPMRDRPGRR